MMSRRLLTAALIYALSQPFMVSRGFGQTETPAPQDSRFRNIFEFEEKLKTAVCDEAAVSRPPALTALSDQPTVDGAHYFLPLNGVSDSDMIAFMLGERFAGRKAPEVFSSRYEKLNLENKFSDSAAIRRKVALEVCEQLVDRQKRANFWETSKHLLIPIQTTAAVGGGNATLIELVDSEGRAGVHSGRVYIAGWIEPFEIQRFSSKFDFVRIIQPITNNPIAIEVLNNEGVALGQLQPSGASMGSSFSKQIEAYRNKIEFFAMARLPALKTPASRDELSKVLSFYRNLLQAYQAMPEAAQFREYTTKAAKWSRASVSADLLNSIASVRVGSSRVEFLEYPKQHALHAIYLEFQNKVRSLH